MKLPTLTENPNWVKMHTTRKDRVKMYKAKKRWVVAGIALLAFGGVTLAGSTGIHASSNPSSATLSNQTNTNAKVNTDTDTDTNIGAKTNTKNNINYNINIGNADKDAQRATNVNIANVSKANTYNIAQADDNKTPVKQTSVSGRQSQRSMNVYQIAKNDNASQLSQIRQNADRLTTRLMANNMANQGRMNSLQHVNKLNTEQRENDADIDQRPKAIKATPLQSGIHNHLQNANNNKEFNPLDNEIVRNDGIQNLAAEFRGKIGIAISDSDSGKRYYSSKQVKDSTLIKDARAYSQSPKYSADFIPKKLAEDITKDYGSYLPKPYKLNGIVYISNDPSATTMYVAFEKTKAKKPKEAKTVTDAVDFVYKHDKTSTSEGTTSITGKNGKSKTLTGNPNGAIAKGFKLANDGTQTFTFAKGKTFNVDVVPSAVPKPKPKATSTTDAVDFVYKHDKASTPEGTTTVTGTIGNPVTLTGNPNSAIAKGFKLANDGTQTFTISKGKTADVNVIPSAVPKPKPKPKPKNTSVTDTVDFVYKHDKASTPEGSTTVTGTSGKSETLTGNPNGAIKPGFKLANDGTQTFTISKGKTADVDVVPVVLKPSNNYPGQKIYNSNSKPKFDYVAQFISGGRLVGQDDLGLETEGYQSTVGQVESSIPNGYVLNGVNGSSKITFGRQGGQQIGEVPVKRKAYTDYAMFSDSSDGYTSSKFPIGKYSDAFTFNMSPKYEANLGSEYRLIDPKFSANESGIGSVTIHIPVIRKIYTSTLPVEIHLESDGTTNGLPAKTLGMTTPPFHLKAKGSDIMFNLTVSSDTDNGGRPFLQNGYSPDPAYKSNEHYDVMMGDGGQQLTPNPKGDNRTLVFYEKPTVEHIKTMYVDAGGVQIPGTHVEEINGDDSVTVDPRDAYHERLREGKSDMPSGYYLILADEYDPEESFSPSSSNYIVKIPVEPRAVKGIQAVNINMEGPSGRQIKINVPWSGVPNKDSVNFSASDYVRPYLKHYQLDTAYPTEYSGIVKGANDLAFRPSLSGGTVQFYLKPIYSNVETRYEDIDTGEMVPGTSVKPIEAPSGTVLTPSKAASERGDAIPTGYQIVPNQNSSYALNNYANSPMINIWVKPVKANGKAITINRFIKAGNGAFHPAGTTSVSLGELVYGKASQARIAPNDFIPNGYIVDNDKDSASDNATVYPELNKNGTVTPSSVNYYYQAEPEAMHVVYKDNGQIVGSDPVNISGVFGQQIKESDIAKIAHVSTYLPKGYLIDNSQADNVYTYGNHQNTATIDVKGVPAHGTFSIYVQTKDYPNDTSDYQVNPPKLVKQVNINSEYGTKQPEFKASDFLSDVPDGYVLDPHSNNQKVSLFITSDGTLEPKSGQATFHYVAGYSGNDPMVKPATLTYVDAKTGQKVGQTITVNGYMGQTKSIAGLVNKTVIPHGYKLLPVNEQTDKSYTFGAKGGNVTALVKAVPVYGTFTITRWLEHPDKSITKIDTIKKQLVRQPNQGASTTTFNAGEFIPNSDVQVDPKQEDDQSSITVYLDKQGNVRPKKFANFYYQDIPAKPVVIKFRDVDTGQPMGNTVTINGYKGEVQPVINIARQAYPEANIASDYTLTNATNSNEKGDTYSFDKGSGIIYGEVKNYPTQIEIPRVLEFPDGETRKFIASVSTTAKLDRGQHKVYYADEFTPFGYEADPHKPATVTVTKNADGSLTENPGAFYYKAMQSNESDSPVTPIQVNYKTRDGQTLSSTELNGFMGEPMNAEIEDSVPDNYRIIGGQDLARTFNQYRNSPVDVYVDRKPVSRTDVSDHSFTTMHSDSDQPTVLDNDYTPDEAKSGRVSADKQATGHKYHYRWFWITKPVQMYGTRRISHRSRRGLLRPGQHLTVKILHIYRHHGHMTYKIRYRHHTRYIRADRSTANAYYSAHDLHHAKRIHGKHYVRIIARGGDYIHRQIMFRHLRKRLHIKHGKILQVIGIQHIGPKHGGMTRFILKNGRYITSNKNFVRLVK